jgi:hypothetical protein
MCRLSRNSGSLNLLETYGPAQPYNGIASPLPLPSPYFSYEICKNAYRDFIRHCQHPKWYTLNPGANCPHSYKTQNNKQNWAMATYVRNNYQHTFPGPKKALLPLPPKSSHICHFGTTNGGKQKVWGWGDLQWHVIHTKYHEHAPTGSKGIEGCTGLHTDIITSSL